MYVHTQFINAAVIVHIQLLNFLNHNNYVIILNNITAEVIFFCFTDNNWWYCNKAEQNWLLVSHPMFRNFPRREGGFLFYFLSWISLNVIMNFIKKNHNVLPMLASTDVVRYSSASGSELSRKPELNSRYTSISVVVLGTPQAYILSISWPHLEFWGPQEPW